MVAPFSEQDHKCFYVNDLEEFERNLIDWDPTLIIILVNGAEGMECVYRAREKTVSAGILVLK